MIDKNIETFILERSDTFLKAADDVAVLYEDHNIAHAKLLLSQYKYTRVPVVNKDKEYVGVLGLNEIVDFEMEHDFFYEKSQKTPISEIVNTSVATVQKSYQLEEVMHLLVKEPFIPVLNHKKFVGIIVRQEILKAFNAFVHDFTKYYDISKRN